MTEWRLLADEHRKASENMAIDESVLRHRFETDLNTLRFFGWEPSAISIGYFVIFELLCQLTASLFVSAPESVANSA